VSAATRAVARGAIEVEPQWSTDQLPRAITAFVGRQAECAAVCELVRQQRLVTLIGPAGCGKTRLAIEAARVLQPSFDRASYIDLAPVRRGEDVAATVAQAMGLAQPDNAALLDAIVSGIGDAATIVVLDNCEQVTPACRDLVEAILGRCDHAHVLATSREPLDWPGEACWFVPPLSLPAAPDPGSIAESGAGELFVDRAVLARGDFVLEEDEARHIFEICRRLDALPLAIELAAARLRTGSTAELLEALEDRFSLLVRTGDDHVDHHASLHQAIDWSYAALAPEEREVFRGLSVFDGSFTMEAGAATCARPDCAPAGAAEIIRRLVDKSLLSRRSRAGRDRYFLLESIREFARARLAEEGDADAYRSRQLAWYTQWAREMELVLESSGVAEGLDEIEREVANLRGAVAYARDGGHRRETAALVAPLAWFWVLRGYLREATRWLDEVLSEPLALETEHDPEALQIDWGRVFVASHRVHDRQVLEGMCRELVERARAADSAWYEGRALGQLGMLQVFFEPESATELLAEALDLSERAGDRFWASYMQGGLASYWQNIERHDLALGHLDQMASSALVIGSPQLEAFHLGRRAMAELHFGDLEPAARHGEAALALGVELTDTNLTFFAISVLGEIALLQGRAADTIEEAERVEQQFYRSGEYLFIPLLRNLGARCMLAEQQPDRALASIEGFVGHPLVASISAFDFAVRETAAIGWWMMGDTTRAATELRLLSDDATEAGNAYRAALADLHLGGIHRQLGEQQLARRHLNRALLVFAKLGSRPDLAAALSELAGLSLDSETFDNAIYLQAAADAINERDGVKLRPGRQPVYCADRERARSAVTADRYEAARGVGASFRIEDVVAYATRSSASRERPKYGWESLTPGERQVVDLATDGSTNPQIAAQLLISRETVKSHLANVYRKLGVNNRSALAAYATRIAASAQDDD
jgi:predicted ATPase/DNA-binding CsgD family transcriptional regulator